MFFAGFILHSALMLHLVAIGFSGNHRDNESESDKQWLTRDRNVDSKIPNVFPNTSLTGNGEEDRIPVLSGNFSGCWNNIYKHFWNSMVKNNNLGKVEIGKMSKSLRMRYDELSKNVTDNIVQIMFYVSEINSLLHYNNATYEEALLNRREIVKDDSFAKSVIVPVLLIVILLLLTYIGFLYRKLQTAKINSYVCSYRPY